MIGKILGQDVPATGFSIGFERVVSILLERPDGPRRRDRRIALLFDAKADDLRMVLRAAGRLRAEGLSVSLELRGKKRGPQRATLSAYGFEGFAEFEGTEQPVIRWLGEEGT
jgi:histidyl-tRNA synthetase